MENQEPFFNAPKYHTIILHDAKNKFSLKNLITNNTLSHFYSLKLKENFTYRSAEGIKNFLIYEDLNFKSN